jgi:molybdopterin molybdotransferase
MLSVTEARERILSHFQTTATESIPLIACANRILAMDIAADGRSSPHSTTQPWMDLPSARKIHPLHALTLKVVADIPAGSAPKVTLKAGEAARIMTGAQLPAGAECRHPVEDTDFHNRIAAHLHQRRSPSKEY